MPLPANHVRSSCLTRNTHDRHPHPPLRRRHRWLQRHRPGARPPVADNGYDLLIAAENEGHLRDAAATLGANGTRVDIHAGDLGRADAVDDLYRALAGRPVEALCVNAGIGLGGPFVDTDLDTELQMIDLNIRGAVHLTN